MTLKEELRLAELAKLGDKPAVGALWDAITPKLFGYLINTLRDRALAEDMLQETWLKAIAAMDRFENRQIRFSAWLFAIARNVCREHWRTNNRVISVPDEELETAAGSADFVSELDNDMDLTRAINTLAAEEQEILRLRYLAEFTFEEISRVLEISSIAARVRLHRAIKKARLANQIK
jgi:RNA polymerase sigma-70 factor (ECF subfamily)